MTVVGKLIIAIICLSVGLIVSVSVTIAVCREYKKERKRVEILLSMEKINGKEVSG